MWKIILVAGYWIALTGTAYAYLDPGAGAIIVQGMIAAAATGLYFMRSRIRTLFRFLTGKKKSQPERDGAE